MDPLRNEGDRSSGAHEPRRTFSCLPATIVAEMQSARYPMNVTLCQQKTGKHPANYRIALGNQLGSAAIRGRSRCRSGGEIVKPDKRDKPGMRGRTPFSASSVYERDRTCAILAESPSIDPLDWVYYPRSLRETEPRETPSMSSLARSFTVKLLVGVGCVAALTLMAAIFSPSPDGGSPTAVVEVAANR